MKKYANAFLRRLTTFIEYFISLMLAAGIFLLAARMLVSLVHIPDLTIYPNYEDLLETCLNLIIGAELIRMVYIHSPSTVFEVLLFALARQVIVEHTSALNSLIGILAIAVLFATRKFLFCEFDESERVIFRATTKISTVNKVIRLQIPYENEQSLSDLLLERFAAENTEIGVGACTYFDTFGLRVAKMHNGKISRVEVIRSTTGNYSHK